MKFTNKLNLPAYLVDWLSNDNYDYSNQPNTISATGILKPLRASILTSRHGENLEMDISDLIASRYGNAIHDSIERIETPGVSKEQRTKRVIEVDGVSFTVTGKYDLLVEENGVHTIRDIKTTSVWAQIYGGKDDDYRAQLSIYRWLLSPTHQINPIAYIDFFFTDWQSSKAKNEENYPSHRIHPGHKIELLSVEETEAIIRAKVKAFLDNEKVPDDQLPLCTPEELWQEEDKFAVYKIGNKKATKLFDNKKDAEAFQTDNKISGHIQHRPGKVKRCNYCSAAPFCSQFKQLQEYKLIAD
jgi:hypothetical protein